MHRILIVTISALLVASCSGDITLTPPEIPVTQLTPDELVVQNCEILRDALETFAAENNGEYPWNTDARSLAGHTVVDLLPDGSELENPYTSFNTVPIQGLASHPGETAWFRTDTNFYVVTGYGESEVVYYDWSDAPTEEIARVQQVISNARIVREAAEAFAADNGGTCPSNLADTAPNGDTMIDYLPGGRLLTNPCTEVPTEPVAGAAASCGQNGYSSLYWGAPYCYGYTIDGAISNYGTAFQISRFSPEDGTVALRFGYLREALRIFASENNCEYPDDVDADTSLAGRTVLEIVADELPHYRDAEFTWNPYLQADAEPRNRPAANPGEVGYIAVEENGVNVGYWINAWGIVGEIQRFGGNDVDPCN